MRAKSSTFGGHKKGFFLEENGEKTGGADRAPPTLFLRDFAADACGVGWDRQDGPSYAKRARQNHLRAWWQGHY